MRKAATRTFGSLFEFIRNGMNIRQDKSGIGLPITRIETISDGFVDLSRVGYAGLRNGAVDKWILEPGDILFSHINSVEHIGKCALYEGSDEPLVHGMNLLCLRPKLSELWPNYAKWLIKSAGFRTLIMPFVNKAVNQASISTKNLKGIEVTIPPLDTQKRIAAILDQADNLRRLRQRAIDRLNELGQAIFYEMFGGDETYERTQPFGELVEEFRYGTSNKATGTGYPTLRIPNVVGGVLDLSDLKTVSVKATELNRLKLKSGDVLFVRTNGNPDYVGRSAVFEPERVADLDFDSTNWIYASYLIRARLKLRKLHPIYLQQFLTTFRGRQALRERCKTSAGQFNINTEGLGSLPIPVPEINKQHLFADKIVNIRSEIDLYTSSANKFDALFSSLQNRAFRGEL